MDNLKKIVILSTSPRKNSNSNALAEEFAKGAKEAGNEVEIISVIGKKIEFCRGCFACQKTGQCVIKDDVNEIEQKVLDIVSEFEMEKYIVYSSFLAESIKIIKELLPSAKTGMLSGTMEGCIQGAVYAGADALHPWIGGMNARGEGRLKDVPIRAWNMEEPFFNDGRMLEERDMGKYSEFGVTDIITNVPEIYLKN